MKELFVMRHAKSSWKDSSLSDFERPLNKRGRTIAPKMGAFMRERGFEPDLVLSSPAARAVETHRLVLSEAGFEPEIRMERAIYEASLNTLLLLISSVPDTFSSLMLTGHNPGFEMLSGSLSGKYLRMPTAALTVFKINSEEWSEFSPENSSLVGHFVPKELFDS